MKILIVDDSKAMRMIVVRTLRQAGYDSAEIVEAANGAEGITAVTQNNPDVILSDWNMPEVSGIEFLRAVRAQGITTTFGFVTSEGGDEMRDLASSTGADFLVSKPFSPEVLGDALTTALVG
jgi:two-component system, chemotaxis family, chemotaxis protein CheY